MTRGAPWRRAIVGGAAAAALVVLAPGLAAAAGPARTVQVGDFNRSPEIEFNSFYPGHVRVVQGTRVKFVLAGFHTVTFPGKGAKLPSFVIPTSTLNPTMSDPAGAAYWWGGATPLLGVNPAAPRPAGGTVVTGRKTVSSGFVSGRKPTFTVSFPKAGTFQVRCLVHPNMRGSVTVVAKGRKGDSAKRQARLAASQKKADRAAVNRAIRKTRSAPANIVTISPGNSHGQAIAFFPSRKSVAAGTALTFKMSGRNEFHTVTFGPKAYVDALSKRAFQGNLLTVDGEGAYASDPPAAGIPVVTPTSHGNGFVNSGILRDPGVRGPVPTSFTVTFPTAGTYSYSCLIHPEMVGTITVS